MVRDFALYVHWPWCVRKCPYCDFNSFAAVGSTPESDYVEALLAHAKVMAERVKSRAVSSVFIGGGTPSLMTEAAFDRLMTGLAHTFTFASDVEISMEANPGTVERSRFASYVQSGVNRFSIGVQSFNAEMLRTLGRIHSEADAWRAIEEAHRVVDNINIDLMFALPGQSVSMLEADLAKALSAQTTHLSYYELTLEAGTAFYKRPPKNIPDADTAADMTELIIQTLARVGFEHYEVSGYAKKGFRCRHNQTYWNYCDYIGIGAGAHGKLTENGAITRHVCAANPKAYMKDVSQGRLFEEEFRVPVENIPFEFMLNALRLTDGVPRSQWDLTTGLPYAQIEPVIEKLRAKKLLEDDPGRIAATDLGQRFLSDIQERFLEL